MEKKVCNKCEIEQDINEFLKNSKMKSGRRSQCKTCINKQRTQRYAANIEEERAKNNARNKGRHRDPKRAEYVKNHKIIDKQCNRCGETFKTDRYKGKDICKQCVDQLKALAQQQKEQEQIRLRQEKEHLKRDKKAQKEELAAKQKLEAMSSRTKDCAACGEVFTGRNVSDKYCSTTCRNKANNKKKEIRKGIRGERIKANGKVDNDISLERLAKRDHGICYLCNHNVEWDDYEITDKGAFKVGAQYPSIEHVIAVVNGGTHTWDNVKLAHFQCNSIKSDKDVNDIVVNHIPHQVDNVYNHVNM